MSKVVDITGKRFGRFVVVERQGSKRSKATWLCKCDCGNTKVISGDALRSGKIRSCGCLRNERASSAWRKINERAGLGIDARRHVTSNKSKYGEVRQYASYSRLYNVWNKMKQRCYNKNAPNYRLYGKRGIRVCDEWRNSFIAFEGWAFANGYDPDAPVGKCTIDRIDPDGDYEPGNCRWVDMVVQRHNRRQQ